MRVPTSAGRAHEDAGNLELVLHPFEAELTAPKGCRGNRRGR